MSAPNQEMEQADGFHKVMQAELEEIRIRRKEAKLPNGKKPFAKGLMGLALSGGGIRSACFNMGLLQALHKTGIWKWVDYLATVSGGGYIGSFLTSTALRRNERFKRDDFPLKENGSSKQPEKVLDFIYGGQYLNKPLKLANRYLIGLLFTNIAVFSGLTALCALIAMAWRCLDFPWIRDRAQMLSLSSDLYAPFWPFILFAVLWLVGWALSYFRDGVEAPGRFAQWMLGATLGSFLIGWAILFGNGDVSMGVLSAFYGEEPLEIRPTLWTPFLFLILVGLLPFLRPARLLQSGLNPRKPWEKYVFNIASTALLFGVPLVIIGFLARENISGYNDDPYRPVVPADIENWEELCALLIDPNPAEKSRKLLLETKTSKAPDLYFNSNTSNAASSENARIDGRFKRIREFWSESFNSNLNVGSEEFDPVESVKCSLHGLDFDEDDADEKFLKNLKTHVPTDSQDRMSYYHILLLEAFQSLSTNYEPSPWLAEFLSAVRKKIDKKFLDGLYLEPVQEDFDSPSSQDEDSVQLKKRLVANYLHYKATLLNKRLREQETARTKLMAELEWSRYRPLHYVTRLYWYVGWIIDRDHEDNPIIQYWNAHTACKQLQNDICNAINHVILPDRKFCDTWIDSQDPLFEQDPSWKPPVGKTARDYHAYAQEQVALAKHTGVDKWPMYEVERLNRRLLENGLDTVFLKRWEVQRRIVINHDQWVRLVWFLAGLGIFAIAGVWIDANATSPHRFYRNQLAHVFIAPNQGKDPNFAMKDLTTARKGGPYHLILASLNRFQNWLPQLARNRSQAGEASKPDQSGNACGQGHEAQLTNTFLLSQRYCGSHASGFVATEEYEKWIRGPRNSLTLAEAMTLSGSAFSPGQARTQFIAFIMLVLNLRLGQWLPNPAKGRPPMRPRVGLLFWQRLFYKPDVQSYCFISDGGNHENLGLVELLKRRCRLIIVSDASCDPAHQFNDLGRAIRQARIHDGIDIKDFFHPEREFHLDALKLNSRRSHQHEAPGEPASPSSDLKSEKHSGALKLLQRCESHFVIGRIRYPEDSAPVDAAGKKRVRGKTQGSHSPKEGLLVYVKPSLTGDESVDVLNYADSDDDFPHQSTGDQIYDEVQVESYRQLGFHIGMELAAQISTGKKSAPSLDLWKDETMDVEGLIKFFESKERAFRTKKP